MDEATLAAAYPELYDLIEGAKIGNLPEDTEVQRERKQRKLERQRNLPPGWLEPAGGIVESLSGLSDDEMEILERGASALAEFDNADYFLLQFQREIVENTKKYLIDPITPYVASLIPSYVKIWSNEDEWSKWMAPHPFDAKYLAVADALNTRIHSLNDLQDLQSTIEVDEIPEAVQEFIDEEEEEAPVGLRSEQLRKVLNFASVYYELVKSGKVKGLKKLPKGWTKKTEKAVADKLTEGEHPFAACVKKMKGKGMKNPEGFCAKMKDISKGTTTWRSTERKKNKKKKK